MTAIWYRARAEMRSRSRALLSLALLIGLAGGFVFAAAAGARRTSSAYDRFLASHTAADVMFPNPDFGGGFAGYVLDPEAVGRMPQVAELSVGRPSFSEHGAAFAAADERFGFEVPRWKLIAGRPYDPARSDEVVVLHQFAIQRGVEVGDRIRYPGTAPEEAPPECANIGAGPQIEMTVVGIAVAPGPFFSQEDEPWSMILPPPVFERLPAMASATGCPFLAFPPTPGMMWVDVHDGRLDELIADLERQGGRSRFLISEPQASVDARSRDSIRLQGTALWILALAAGLATALVLVQLVARQISLGAEDNPTLRALGATGRQMLVVAAVRIGFSALAGVVVAGAIAFAASPLTPLGTARLAEPAEGFSLDLTVLGLGGAAVVAIALFAAMLGSVAAGRGAREGERRAPSVGVAVAAGAGAPASVVAGVSMALEPGRGRSSVPVRSTVAGVALGLGMLAAALTFDASARHLLGTPAAYGLTVDLWMHNDPGIFPFHEHLDAVRENPDVVGAAIGNPGTTVLLDGRSVQALPFEPVKGNAQPRVFRGRYPSALDEVMLGARTAAMLGKDVGDTVLFGRADDPEAPQRSLDVVAVGEIPPVELAGLGEGAIVTPVTAEDLASLEEGGARGLFIDVRDGADPDAVAADLKRAFGDEDLQHFAFGVPTDVVDFGRVRNLPAILAFVLALIAAATLAHVLLSAVRRRRRDLAVLKTLGFVRAQMRAAVAWHAIVTVTLGAAIGLPLGVTLGRWAWAAVIGRAGLSPIPIVPLAWVLLLVPAALLAANLVAAVPASVAARTQPAVVLRSE